MPKRLIPLLLLSSSSVLANTVHISPAMTFGPYIGAGISGGGLQLGLTDRLGWDAVYFSYSHTSAQFLLHEKDRLKTYRLGVQTEVIRMPGVSVQFEAGLVEYDGKKKYWGDDEVYTADAIGASISFAWVHAITDNIAVRSGGDLNFIDRDKTFLPYDLSATISMGIVMNF